MKKQPIDASDSSTGCMTQTFKPNLLVVGEADEIITKGGVYALIGPTGVGKTTTTAKLAAIAVKRYGCDKVGMLTTDSYRVGAHEQLRIFAKILDVNVQAVRDTEDLRHSISALKKKHLVLIDTTGLSQRDSRVAVQTEMFNAAGVQCLLLLNATSDSGTLEEVVHKYHGRGVIGFIATKLDEAVNPGTVLDIAEHHRLVMHYMTDGPRVPHDLHLITPNFNWGPYL